MSVNTRHLHNQIRKTCNNKYTNKKFKSFTHSKKSKTASVAVNYLILMTHYGLGFYYVLRASSYSLDATHKICTYHVLLLLLHYFYYHLRSIKSRFVRNTYLIHGFSTNLVKKGLLHT